MKKQKQKIVKQEGCGDKTIVPQQPLSAESLISQAIIKGVPVETMERLMAMRRELKAEHAKEMFDHAMAEFQSECPIIKKEKQGGRTKAGVVAYKFAPLDAIVAQTKDLIRKHGFKYMFKTKTRQGTITATCIVTHEAGHSEESEFEVSSTGGTDVR
jgi:hypothetical protein